MKKKLLISIFPALMTLSACGGVRPAEAPKDNFYFEEDALAHDEDFAKCDSTYINKAFRNLTTVDTTEPLIAIQKSDEYTLPGKEGNFISVRFVAAVPKGQESSSMVWTRSMYDYDGVNVVEENTYESTHPYTVIHDGEGTLDIANFYGGAYGCFITYTLRKISTNYSQYFLKASLSIGGAASTKEVATSIDLSKQVSFPLNQEGYFMCGKIQGEQGIVEKYDRFIGENDYSAFRVFLHKYDSFYIVLNDKTSNKFKVYGSSDYVLDGNFTENFGVNEDKSYSTKDDGVYKIIISKDNDGKLYSAKARFWLAGLFNNWATTIDTSCELTYNNVSKTYSLNKTLGVDSNWWKFGVRSTIDGSTYHMSNQNTWLNCGYQLTDGFIDPLISTEMKIYYYPNDAINPVGLEANGNPGETGNTYPRVTKIYIVGTASSEEKEDEYCFEELLNSDEYYYKLENVYLHGNYDDSKYFKIKSEDESIIWQWNTCMNNGHQVFNNESPRGTAGEESGNNHIYCKDYNSWNILCGVSGYYDLYIRKDFKLVVNDHPQNS